MPCKIVNIHNTDCWHVYIGRPGSLGNPYVVGRDGNRAECIYMFKRYALRRARLDPEFKRKLLNCEGQILGCHCKPLACHGDVFDEIIEELQRD